MTKRETLTPERVAELRAMASNGYGTELDTEELAALLDACDRAATLATVLAAQNARLRAALERISRFGNFTDATHCQVRNIARAALAALAETPAPPANTGATDGIQ